MALSLAETSSISKHCLQISRNFQTSSWLHLSSLNGPAFSPCFFHTETSSLESCVCLATANEGLSLLKLLHSFYHLGGFKSPPPMYFFEISHFPPNLGVFQTCRKVCLAHSPFQSLDLCFLRFGQLHY